MPFGKGHLGKVAFCFRTQPFFKCDFVLIVTKICNRKRLFVQTFRFTGEIRNGNFVVEKNFEV